MRSGKRQRGGTWARIASTCSALGYERRAVDAIFRGCPVVVLPGYSRPLIRVSDYTSFLERCTYDGKTRVR
jgi:hypothetical protein